MIRVGYETMRTAFALGEPNYKRTMFAIGARTPEADCFGKCQENVGKAAEQRCVPNPVDAPG